MNGTNIKKYDLHFHTMISRQLPFTVAHFNAMIIHAGDIGVGTIAVTDHIESSDYRTVQRYLRDTFVCTDGAYDVFGVQVFPGTEVETSEDTHVLFHGEESELDELYERMLPDIRAGRFPTVKELFDMTASLSLVTVWAHPFRFVGAAGDPSLGDLMDEDLIRRVDAIDFNAKDIYLYGDEMATLVRRAATEYALPLVGGSDAHHPSQVGSVFNTSMESVVSGADVRRVIAAGGMVPHSTDTLPEQVARAEESKRRVLLEASIL